MTKRLQGHTLVEGGLFILCLFCLDLPREPHHSSGLRRCGSLRNQWLINRGGCLGRLRADATLQWCSWSSGSQNYLDFSKGLYQVVWQTPGLNFFLFCPVFEAYVLIMGARNFLSSVLKIDGIRRLKLPVAISHPLECLYYFVCSQKHGS